MENLAKSYVGTPGRLASPPTWGVLDPLLFMKGKKEEKAYEGQRHHIVITTTLIYILRCFITHLGHNMQWNENVKYEIDMQVYIKLMIIKQN